LLVAKVVTSSDKTKLREVLKDVCYQVLNESLKWLRDNTLRYGKNATYDLEIKIILLHFSQKWNSNEIDNPQPSS
jgi:hypothetical protein